MTQPAPLTGGKRIAMYVTTGLVGLGLLASAGAKLSGAAQIVENFEKFHLGPYRTGIGVLEALVALLFLVPRTSSIGTLLVTGYFGGAIVAHLVVDAPGEIVAPLVLGGLAWASGFLRNPNLFGSLTK